MDKEVADESEPEPEPEEVSDVEIIYDETIEEEEEVEEEEISDVDDTELLSRLEAKYGRLPEPERPGQNSKMMFTVCHIITELQLNLLTLPA